MKRIIVFTLVLCSLTCIFSQKKSLTIYTLKTEYEKTDSNTYIIEYNSNGDKDTYSGDTHPVIPVICTHSLD